MQPKIKAVTATFLGTVLAACPAFAQNVGAGANVGAGNQGIGAGVNAGAGNQGIGAGANVGAGNQGIGAGVNAGVGNEGMQPNVGARRRGGGVQANVGTAGTVQCPEGCVPARPPLSRAQREAARRRARERAERARQREQERAQLSDQLNQREQSLQQCQTELSQERAQLAQLQNRYDQDIAEQRRLAANAQNDLARERAMRAQVRRGGGPVMVNRYRPYFTIGLSGGASGYSVEMADAMHAGGAWGLRLGVDFFDWFGIEGRYFGAFNNAQANVFGDQVGLLTSGGSGVVRFTAPLGWFHPYVFGGIGGYGFTVVNRTNANTALVSYTSGVAPVGGGIDFMIGRHFSIGAEGAYHILFNRHSFSTNTAFDNGDIWTAEGVVRFRL